MTDKLQEICDVKREHVAAAKARHSFAEMDNRAKSADLPRGFMHTLRAKQANAQVGLICEIKKASPSAGLIRPDFNPAALANAYEAGGAACLSILTDEPYFQGCNEFLIEGRAACALPVLRKDFIIDVWQVAEARSIGADCILLIMAVLSDQQALELHSATLSYGMDVLIEVHDAAEMDRALRLPSGMIGINNRNLKTLNIDLATTESLAAMAPTDRLLVSESGIKTRDDIARLRKTGITSFLIGESLMKQEDVTAATRLLLA